MTTKPRARKFRIRRSEPLQGQGERALPPAGPKPEVQPIPEAQATVAPQPTPQPANAPAAISGQVDSANQVQTETDIDAIRKEGLTGRQLRLARRVAQKYGLPVTSDFDAVRQLRLKGIDPFEKSSILELVAPGGNNAQGGQGNQAGRIQLPQTVATQGRAVGQYMPANPAENRAKEIAKIQKEMLKRRRRKLALLGTRLGMFVLLPTFLVGFYFFGIATKMYATSTEFVIQQADSGGAGAGLGGLFQGTSMATQQDSIAVQSYLSSRSAMVRLDEEHGFKAHFSGDNIDPIQRLKSDATNEAAFKLYNKQIRLSYDPTEGILKMEVVAADPATSQKFAEALVGYAEEQVDELTQRLRLDQMIGAEQGYQDAETRRTNALQELLRIQNEVAVLSPEGEVSAVLAQIGSLETQKQQKQLELLSFQSVSRPNQARVNAIQQEIENLNNLIGQLRGRMTETSGAGTTLAAKATELRIAEENYQFQTLMVQQALSLRETARVEAERQVRYLSVGVEPIAPDEYTYPRAFENTLVSFLIFAGLYLMISLTASVLREQVSS